MRNSPCHANMVGLRTLPLQVLHNVIYHMPPFFACAFLTLFLKFKIQSSTSCCDNLFQAHDITFFNDCMVCGCCSSTCCCIIPHTSSMGLNSGEFEFPGHWDVGMKFATFNSNHC